MKFLIINTIRSYLGLDSDIDKIMINQEKIIEQLDQLKRLEIEGQKNSFYDYLTLRNILLISIVIGVGYVFFFTDYGGMGGMLDSFKNMGSLSKDLVHIDNKAII
jgi:hypothetical protein